MFSSFLNRHTNSLWVRAGQFALALGVLIPAKIEARPDVRADYGATFFVSDNPFLLPGKNRGSSTVDLFVRSNTDWQLTQRTALEFQGDASFRQYEKRYGSFTTGLANLRLRHRHNEYLTVTAQAAYERELVTDTLTDTPDFTADTRGIGESIRTNGTIAWTPNAKITVVSDLGWREQRYPDSIVLDTTRTRDFTLSVSRRLSERTTIGVQTRLTSNHTVNGEDSSVKSLNLTASRRFSDAVRGDIQFGVERSKVNASIAQPQETRTNFNGSANICHEGTRTTACLTGALRSEINNFGELQRETSVSGTVRHRVSELGTIIADANYRRARLPDFSAPARNLRAAASYEHRFANNLHLIPGVAYLQRNRLAGEKVSAFVFQIGLLIRGERR